MRRRAALVLAVLALVAALAGPAAAAPVVGEASRVDDYLTNNSVTAPVQGYARLAAADFNDGGRPDCAVATGRSPTSGSGGSGPPVGVGVNPGTTRKTAEHTVHAKGPGGVTLGIDWTYWLHTQQDIASNTTTICLSTAATTNADGYFTVTYPRALSATPAFVVWSASSPNGGNTYVNGNLVTFKDATGFQGRALKYTGLPCGSCSLVVDYWADTRTTANENGLEAYHHQAGQVSVTTDGAGVATIDHPDFEFGDEVTSGQVTGTGPATGANIPGGILLTSAGQTLSLIKVWNQAGQLLTNQTISVQYVIAGPVGGGLRPIPGLGGGYFQHRTPGNPEQEYVACGITTPCVRWAEGEPNYLYKRTAAFSALGAVEGTDPDVYYENAITKWEQADLRLPNFTFATSGTERLLADAQVLGTGCADQITDVEPDLSDGYSYVTHSTTRHNTAVAWSNVANYQAGECPIESVYLHELGHGNGLHHNQITGSIMGSHIDDDIPTVDIERPRAIYGYSGSTYPPGLKVSTLARGGAGRSVGVVTVTGRPAVTRPDGRHTQTAVSVAATPWSGRLPGRLWVSGGIGIGVGETQPELTIASDSAPLDAMKPGTRWLVMVRDRDATVVEALPVVGRTVRVLESMHATDDIDGGNPLAVDLAKLKATAR